MSLLYLLNEYDSVIAKQNNPKNPHNYGCAHRGSMTSTLVPEYIVPVYL